MSKYKDFVEEFKVNSKNSDKHNYFSYLIKNAKMKDTHFEPIFNEKKDNYYTTEPTERISETYITRLPTTGIPTMQTFSPTSLLPYATQYPSTKNATTFTPTIKFSNNNINNNINNDLIIALTISLSGVFFTLFSFMIYYNYNLKYKTQAQLQQKERLEQKERQEQKENELDLSFGLSYVDDI